MSPGAVFHNVGKAKNGSLFTNSTLWAGTNKSYALGSCRAGFLSALVCHTPVKEKGSCLKW